MRTAAPTTVAVRRPRAGARWRGRAFGLELDGSFPVPGAAASRGRRTSRRASLELVSPETLEREWRPHEAAPVVDRRFPDGRPFMIIERHDELGYRIWAPRHGRHLVSADGRRIRSALPRDSTWRWQLLFFAQVLPLAARLQGLELFHASAVALGDHAVGFVAPSGTGKTSIAAHLVARGASLVTDDVMALEPSPEGVLAHPGASLASIDRSELQAMTAEGRRRLGHAIGRSDKVHLAPELVDRPLRLGLVYFLRRGPQFERLELDESRPPDPRLLLASGFVSYLRSPEHVVNHLDACVRIAGSVRVFEARVPTSARAREVAEAIEAHAGAALREAKLR